MDSKGGDNDAANSPDGMVFPPRVVLLPPQVSLRVITKASWLVNICSCSVFAGKPLIRKYGQLRAPFFLFLFLFFCLKNVNDPSAGSPTDTVLRLLHPLDDKAHDTSLRRAMQGTSDYSGPCNLPDHPIG